MTTTHKPQVQIFVLAHNRPQLLRETLLSILSQDEKEFELIVSDNSSNDSVQELIANEFVGRLTYRKRTPSLSPIAHFQTLLDEAHSEYLVLFHDDDLMSPSFVRVLKDFLNQHKNYSAAAPNAYLRINDHLSTRIFFPGAQVVTEVRSEEEMAYRYLDLSQFRMPFPGYMYRTAMIRGIKMNPKEGGKHADVSFLTKVANAAPVAWLGQPLFEYRIHSGNDSWSENIPSRLSLLRFVYRTTTITRKSKVVNTYKLAYWYLWWRSNRGRSKPWRRRVAFRFLLKSALVLPLRQPGLIINVLKHRLYYLF